MAQCGPPFDKTALVLEWHVLGMFLPSFFTGALTKRVGVLLNLACIYSVMTPTSFSSGALVMTGAWSWMNWGSLAPLALTALALLWLARQARLQPA